MMKHKRNNIKDKDNFIKTRMDEYTGRGTIINLIKIITGVRFTCSKAECGERAALLSLEPGNEIKVEI